MENVKVNVCLLLDGHCGDEKDAVVPYSTSAHFWNMYPICVPLN